MDKQLFPKEIILETTNYCNLRCRFCHFHAEQSLRRRKRGYLSRQLWQKILDDLASWVEKAGEVTLCLHGAGEPLLHPELKNFLLEARKIPHIKLGFMTNAMLLNKSWAEFLVSLPLDWLWFSVDGATAETNDFFRRGAQLEVIEKNIDRLIKEKRNRGKDSPLLFFNMVAYPEVSDEEKVAYLKRWLPHATGISISRFRPLKSKRLLTPEERAQIKERPCPLLYRQMVIGWDGRVGLCCEDINIEYQLGDVNKEGLLEIFNGPQARAARKAHEEQHKDRISLCRDCDVWAAEELLKTEEKILGRRKVQVLYRPAGVYYAPIFS